MTDREKAIVMAYTGKCMLKEDKFHVFHEYIEDIMGRPVYTHELADKDIQDEIKEKAKADFIALCEEEEQELCDDTVSRAKLIDKLEIVDKMYGSDFYWEVRKIVDNLPLVKPVQKKGKWITKYHGFPPEPTTVCSECGFDRDFNINTRGFCKIKYCPRCGMKMVSDE